MKQKGNGTRGKKPCSPKEGDISHSGFDSEEKAGKGRKKNWTLMNRERQIAHFGGTRRLGCQEETGENRNGDLHSGKPSEKREYGELKSLKKPSSQGKGKKVEKKKKARRVSSKGIYNTKHNRWGTPRGRRALESEKG